MINRFQPHELLERILTQFFGLSSDSSSRIEKVIAHSGERLQMRRKLQHLPNEVLTQLNIVLDKAEKYNGDGITDKDEKADKTEDKKTVKESPDDFIDFMITELDARQAAKNRVQQQSRDERIQDARMSDQALAKKKAEELQAMQQSQDPIDRQIVALQLRIDQLMLKKQKMNGGNSQEGGYTQ